MILRKKHRKITLTDEKKYLLRLLTIEKTKTEKNQPCGRSEFDDSFLFETDVIETELVSLFVSI